jgi:hypothetical protein
MRVYNHDSSKCALVGGATRTHWWRNMCTVHVVSTPASHATYLGRLHGEILLQARVLGSSE